MKISIRKYTFETNSSSNHSLILTNEKAIDKDKEEFKKDFLFSCFGGFLKPIKDKSQKAYFLAALFEYENNSYSCMEDEYEIFIKVLEDNNETEILEHIKLNIVDFKKHGPYCEKFFNNGTLDDCICNFKKIFYKYFELTDINDLYDLKTIMNMTSDEYMKIKNDLKIKNTSNLYQKIYDFLYKDGIMIPYEYI